MDTTTTPTSDREVPGVLSSAGAFAAVGTGEISSTRVEGRFDRIGALASGACAIHCAATPFVLMLAPVLGAAWADPMVHWIIAGIALPLAALVLFRGFRRHRKVWIATCATLGIAAIVVGLWIPGVPGAASPPSSAELHASAPACADHCCPTLHVADDGGTQLSVPPASIATFIGGVFLVLAHLGNLRSCRRCTRR